jgi:hypothetical protein
MANLVKNKDIRLVTLGIKVAGAAKTVPQNATQTVFTVTGGRIFIATLYGLVSTIIGGTTPSAKYVATPTTGTANDMCTAVAITTDEVGTMWQVPSAVGSALIVAASTGKSGSLGGNTGGLCGQIVAPGTIGFNVSAADATGAVIHTLVYVPLDDTASVAAN